MGIAVIYQELNVLGNLTVAENVMLGHEPAGKVPGTINREKMREAARKTLAHLHFDLPVDQRVGQLSAARQCMVEIARAMHGDVRLMVFDEPTASLGDEDVEKLFEVIRELKGRGLGMIYISHRLAELPRIADRVSVLRDAKMVGTRAIVGCKLSELTTMMLGRELIEVFPAKTNTPGDVVLKVEGLTRPGVFEDVSFELRAGEILGIAGLVGSGRTEIARAVFGAERAEGRCQLLGRPLRGRSPVRCKNRGIGMVPDDRKQHGVVTGRSIAENINLGIMDRLASPLGYLSPRRVNRSADQWIAEMGVDPPLRHMVIQKLSGGNQQKVVVGRWLAVDPAVLIFDEPTHGIDVGTKTQVYRLLNDLATAGKAIILISSELIELAKLADRILVVRDGRLVRELAERPFDEESLFVECMEQRDA
jgi:ribose transport system ATP-binding protein